MYLHVIVNLSYPLHFQTNIIDYNNINFLLIISIINDTNIRYIHQFININHLNIIITNLIFTIHLYNFNT